VTPTHAVSPYLLAEGHFSARCRAGAARAEYVADVLGVHPAVVELVAARVIALAKEAVA
jgi:sirohydrochlorin ferrochelatase